MDSVEKVGRMRERLQSARPEDEDHARGLQSLASLSPLITKFLPSDPDELDGYLAAAALWALSCRSDGAPVLQVHVWNEESQAWEVFAQ